MELADVPRHRPLVFDKMESLIKEMQDPESGVPVKSQKLFLSFIPSAFTGFDVVEWLLERFSLDDTTNVEAVHIGTQLCQHGYFFPVNDLKNLTLKDDSSLYRFQSPYYWPWQPPRLSGSGSTALTLAPDNVEYAIYLVKRTLRNKQRHGLEEYEQEALATLKKNLAAKWEFITMQAEEQVRIAKDRKKGDKIVSDSQERAYWRVARPPPGVPHALESCPVPVRCRQVKPKKRSIEQLKREIQHLKASLDRTRVKTSIALEALMAYSETFAPYDPLLTPPQPSNPWVSDDTLFWQINSPFVEVPSEKRVQRWALSIEELVSDPTGLQEFTSFLRKEYSHENIRFWLAVMDLRRSSTTQIPTKLEEIYDEFLKPGAPCEINIDGATAERVAEGMRSGSRYAFDHAAEHVYGLLLKKDCYPRFIRSDHFQRLLTEGRNVHQKKAKFFNFGGQVKKKPGSTSGSGGSSSASGTGLARRRGSDRSLSGSAHELAVCAAQPPRPADPPSHSHSQSNLTEIPFRDPLEDDAAEVLPWECSSREGAYGARRRQDSAADSGSSSSDVSAAVAIADRTRRLPQQSTLDGGLRGAPPPLRRLSAIEPRHLAPLASPPHSPRLSRPAPLVQPSVHVPPHPTPTISVSSAPDDESTETPTGNISPEEPRSMAHSEEPSSVFASADATPTDPARPLKLSEVTVLQIESNSDDSTGTALASELPDRKANVTVTSASLDDSCDDSIGSGKPSDRRESDPTRSSEDDIISQEASAAKDTRQIRAQRMDSSEVSMSVERKDDGTETILVTDRTSVSDSEVIRCSVLVNIPMVVDESEEFDCNVHAECLASMSVGETSIRSPVAPLAVGEDIGADDDNLDKVPATPPMKVSDTRAASESDAIRAVAHRDELTSVSESDIVKRDNKSSSICERKQRNDICPWEDENSCESDAPFVKTYATLGYL